MWSAFVVYVVVVVLTLNSCQLQQLLRYVLLGEEMVFYFQRTVVPPVYLFTQVTSFFFNVFVQLCYNTQLSRQTLLWLPSSSLLFYPVFFVLCFYIVRTSFFMIVVRLTG